MDSLEVSVVFPVFDERDNLPTLVAEIDAALDAHAHEIIAVDDKSTDGSLEVLRDLSERFPQLRVVAMPIRSGQSAALLAGFDTAKGSTIVTLDADGQNDPADVPRMLELLNDSAEIGAVVGFRAVRAASGWKRLQARVANAVRDVITGDRVRDTGCALRVARREDLRKLPRFRGMHRFIPTLLRREGVVLLELPVRDRLRQHGVSKYGMWNRVFIGLVDAWGVRWLNRRAVSIAPGDEKGPSKRVEPGLPFTAQKEPNSAETR